MQTCFFYKTVHDSVPFHKHIPYKLYLDITTKTMNQN